MKHQATPSSQDEARTIRSTPPPDNLRDLPMILRVSEVAEVLRVDPDTVYSMVHRGGVS